MPQDIMQKPTLMEVARQFFDACESGKGWEGRARYCTPDATFSAQADALADVKTLKDYTEWNKGILVPFTDVTLDIKSFAFDEVRGNVSVYATMTGTHTGTGGPVPPTGKKATVDYVYCLEFASDRVRHMTKIWNDRWSFRLVGWL